MPLAFVYGTLKRGFPYGAVLKGQRLLGRGLTCEPFPLVIAGRWYSPVLLAEPGRGQRVFGELYQVDDMRLDQLDRMEGTHLPGGYGRIAIAVEKVTGGECLDAWTYVKERAKIDLIHSGFLQEYPLDPRYVPAEQRHG